MSDKPDLTAALESWRFSHAELCRHRRIDSGYGGLEERCDGTWAGCAYPKPASLVAYEQSQEKPETINLNEVNKAARGSFYRRQEERAARKFAERLEAESRALHTNQLPHPDCACPTCADLRADGAGELIVPPKTLTEAQRWKAQQDATCADGAGAQRAPDVPSRLYARLISAGHRITYQVGTVNPGHWLCATCHLTWPQDWGETMPIAACKSSTPPSQKTDQAHAQGMVREWLVEDVKPPLGVLPRWRHNELRATELLCAMLRYVEAGKTIPREWLDELTEYVHAVPRVE